MKGSAKSMKKLLVVLLMLAFVISCENKKNRTENVKNSGANVTVKQEKPQNPKGPTVSLNQVDFRMENNNLNNLNKGLLSVQ